MQESVDEILDSVFLNYRGLKSYRDRGSVKLMYDLGSTDESTSTLTFETSFKRPDMFRFEWVDSEREGLNLVWSDGKNTYSKYSFKTTVTKEKNLDTAIAGATGAGLSVRNVSGLLMEEIGGKNRNRDEFSYLGEEKVNDEVCYCITQTKRNRKTFISKSRFVILRIDEDYVIESKCTEKNLRLTRFRSFISFCRWFKCLLERGFERDDDLRVTSTIVYEKVTLNSNIPDSSFICQI